MSVIHYGTPPFTYASGEGGSPLGGDSTGAFSGAEPSSEVFFPRFEAIPSGSSEVVLFFPWLGEFSIPPFLTASFAEAVAPWFPSSPSTGSLISSILVNTGSGTDSGRGAGHLISFAFAIHSCSKDSSVKGPLYDENADGVSKYGATYLSIRVIAAQTCVLGQIRTPCL